MNNDDVDRMTKPNLPNTSNDTATTLQARKSRAAHRPASP